MQIAEARAYRQWQPFVDGTYACSGGVAEGFDSTIVELVAADGTTGFGEAAPLGAFYAEAFPAGIRAGVTELLPLTIGADARTPRALLHTLDRAMMGQRAAKAAIDMATCDLAARLAGVPLCAALGGRHGDSVDLYRSIVGDDPAVMAERARAHVADGYRRIQVKVGADPLDDAERLRAVHKAVGNGIALVCDANGSWSSAAALRFLQRTRDLDYALEQPCTSLPECALVRARCERPLVLDESIVDLESLLAARQIAGCDAVTIKLARVGGVSRAALLRDVACELGLLVTIEDTGGSDIATAAMAHASISTPAQRRLHTVDFNAWVTVANASGMPAPRDGGLGVPDGPGLGVEVDAASLGAPFARA
ncbi:MAG TPA: mandelate racemase/muconate lactonizing enzyme family protein [Gaiellales bacterium]|jgi:L-alanine-DL-glutamate epimerase-like enolase superfamily enzyme